MVVDRDVRGADVDVDRQLEIAEHLVERVPVGLPEVGETTEVWFTRHQHAGEAEPLDPLRFADGGRDVPERQQRLGEQSSWSFGLPLRDRVVVHRDDRGRQVAVEVLHERGCGEPERVRIHDLGPDPQVVHQGETRLRVVGRLVDVLPGPPDGDVDGEDADLVAVAVDEARAAGVEEHLVAEVPVQLPLAVRLHARNPVAVLRRCSRRPQVVGLRVMRVRVDHVEVLERAFEGLHRASRRRSSERTILHIDQTIRL